jgi:hypothetical protein
MLSRALLLIVLFLGSLPRPASAQTISLPAIVEFDHDGHGVKGFVLYATRREDGAERRFDLGMPSKARSGRFQIAVPTLEEGTWRFELAAYNGDGESPRAKANPGEVRVDRGRKSPAPPPASAKAPAPRSPGAGKPTPPPSQKPPPPKKKKGAMKKLWGLIVGEDDPK